MTRISFTLRYSKGAYDNIITNPVGKGFREISIASTHMFCTGKSRIHQNYDRIFPYFGPNVYALAFMSLMHSVFIRLNCEYGNYQYSLTC